MLKFIEVCQTEFVIYVAEFQTGAIQTDRHTQLTYKFPSER